MKKEEVELILFGITYNNEELIKMKFYRDGVVLRQGCGTSPAINVLAMSEMDNSDLFNAIIDRMPEQALTEPINYEEENIKQPLEYYLAFYSDKSNSLKGESATFNTSMGLRFLMDNDTTFSHPALQLIDAICVDVALQTESWYFDMVIAAKYNCISTTLPEQSIVTAPNKEDAYLEKFLNVMAGESNLDKLNGLTADKVYVDKTTKIEHELKFRIEGKELKYSFEDIKKGDHSTPETPKKKKKWWKF